MMLCDRWLSEAVLYVWLADAAADQDVVNNDNIYNKYKTKKENEKQQQKRQWCVSGSFVGSLLVVVSCTSFCSWTNHRPTAVVRSQYLTEMYQTNEPMKTNRIKESKIESNEEKKNHKLFYSIDCLSV